MNLIDLKNNKLIFNNIDIDIEIDNKNNPWFKGKKIIKITVLIRLLIIMQNLNILIELKPESYEIYKRIWTISINHEL